MVAVNGSISKDELCEYMYPPPPGAFLGLNISSSTESSFFFKIRSSSIFDFFIYGFYFRPNSVYFFQIN